MLFRYSIVAMLLLASQSLYATEIKGSPSELSNYLLDQRRIVTISGNAEIKAEADKAIVTLTIKTEDDKYSKALAKNRDIAKKIEQDLKQSGLKDSDIRLAKFSSTPDYGWFKDKPSSYAVNNDMKVTIHNNRQMQAVGKIVDGMKQVYLTRTEFEHSSKGQSEQDVLQKALRKIAQKKSLYERNLDMKLKAVRVMDQRTWAQSPAPQVPQKRGMVAMEAKMDSYSGPAAQGFGEMVYHASVSVEYVVNKAGR